MKRITFLLLLCGLTISAPADAQHLKVFKDWAIGCDNTNACTAMGAHVEALSFEKPVSLTLQRKAGPYAPLTLSVNIEEGSTDESRKQDAADKVNAKDYETAKRELFIDGKLLLSLAVNATLTDDAQIRALIARAMNAQALEVRAGTIRRTVSLEGMKAALLMMDEVQGRVGTAGALVRKGSRAESSVPAAKPPLRIHAAKTISTGIEDKLLVASLHSALAPRSEECESDDGATYDQAYQLTETQLLYMQSCYRGAYQTGYHLWLVDKQTTPYSKDKIKARKLLFPDPYDESRQYERGGEVNDTLVTPDLSMGTLSSAAKGRGIGDCWTSQEYVWTGKDFALTRYTTNPWCRGLMNDTIDLINGKVIEAK